MQYKLTKSLFYGKYQYKVVLVCPGASLFRKDFDSILSELKVIKLRLNMDRTPVSVRRSAINTQEDLDYIFKLNNYFSSISDFFLRVESPWISFYTNDKKSVDGLIKIKSDNIKYICKPPDSGLPEDTVVMPKIDFEFRVTLGKTNQEHSTFIGWAEQTSKVKLTKSCKNALSRAKSWGGTYFYITGDKNLLLAKMHLGGSISKVERIIKA